jgi:hypothetical protein
LASTGSTQLSFDRKYRQMVRVESPAAEAMSSPLVPDTPSAQNSAQACLETANRAAALSAMTTTSPVVSLSDMTYCVTK